MVRLATFNIESLDAADNGAMPLARFAVLGPILDALCADILCLQEIDGQKIRGTPDRDLGVLSALLAETRYAGWPICSTRSENSAAGVLATHNLVIVSRFPFKTVRDLKHQTIAPIGYRAVTAVPEPARDAIAFDRPVLRAEIELPDGAALVVYNAHFRAALASPIAGGKMSAGVWNTSAGWAEGLFVSTVKRSAQALDVRLDIDRTFDADPNAMIAVTGDLNAERYEMPVRILVADAHETGNPDLAGRALTSLDTHLPEDERYTTRYGDRPQMLDHMLVSASLAERVVAVTINHHVIETRPKTGNARAPVLGSTHAPIVAEFDLGGQ